MGVVDVVMRVGEGVVGGDVVSDGREGGVRVVVDGREDGRGEGVFDTARVGMRVGGLGVNDG